MRGCACRAAGDVNGDGFADVVISVATNLTPGQGGIGDRYTEEDWDRAIRHGIRPDGSFLFIMPSPLFHELYDADAAALVSYLKTLPAVDNELPPTRFRLPGRIMSGLPALRPEEFVVITETSNDPPPAPADRLAFGKYLAATTCVGCHGKELHGAPHPDPNGPPAPDLAPVGAWALPDFIRAMRTGIGPAKQAMNPQWMPWRRFQFMTDQEMEALHHYLGTLGEAKTS